jgi:succinoglycan biosynthesis transport protein ExoP
MATELSSRNMVMGGGKGPMETGLDAQRVLNGIWRRRKTCLAVALVIGAIGAGVVATSPNVYKASAVVRVEPARMSPEMVQATVTQQIEDRLKTIRAELFSRPILERTVEELGLYPDTVKKQGIGAAADELKRHLDVKVEGENAFEVTFEDGNATTAAAVANRLPELFADESLKVRADQAQHAQELFGDELTKLGREGALQEQKLNEFKLAHLGELPEQMESNMRGLERLTAMLGARSDALRDAQRRLVEASKGRIEADSDAGRLGHRESDLNQALLNARSQYTSDHPEVQRLEREVAVTHAKRVSSEADARARDTSRSSAAAEVSALQRDIASIQTQADAYKQRLDNTPRWSVPLAELNGMNEMLKAKYGQMMSRKVEADVAHDLELRNRAQMFHVLSAASEPTSPVRPDRVAGFLLVAVLSLALAMLAGVGLELTDDSLREAGELHASVKLPVLAVVPELGKAGLFGSGKTLRPQINKATLDA